MNESREIDQFAAIPKLSLEWNSIRPGSPVMGCKGCGVWGVWGGPIGLWWGLVGVRVWVSNWSQGCEGCRGIKVFTISANFGFQLIVMSLRWKWILSITSGQLFPIKTSVFWSGHVRKNYDFNECYRSYNSAWYWTALATVVFEYFWVDYSKMQVKCFLWI